VGEQSNDAEQPNDTERSSDTGPTYSAAPRDLGTMDVFNRSFDVMASLITRHRMASNPPDVLVTVPSDACRTMDFHRAAEMIDLGRRLTIEAMDAAGR
jgi:NTE family protein